MEAKDTLFGKRRKKRKEGRKEGRKERKRKTNNETKKERNPKKTTTSQALPIGTFLALETSAHRLCRLYWLWGSKQRAPGNPSHCRKRKPCFGRIQWRPQRKGKEGRPVKSRWLESRPMRPVKPKTWMGLVGSGKCILTACPRWVGRSEMVPLPCDKKTLD